MNTALHWLGIYLLIGLSFIASVHIKGWLSKGPGKYMRWKEEPVAQLAILLLWLPGVGMMVGILVYESIFNRPRPQPARIYRTLIATPDSLIEQLSIAAIEQVEIYNDPFKAVPQLPFGHLHEAWLRFLHTLQPSDQIWSFRVDTINDEGLDWCHRYGVVEGYAVLQDGEIVGEFFARMG